MLDEKVKRKSCICHCIRRRPPEALQGTVTIS